MPRPNQVVLNDADQYYYCCPCQRQFSSEHSLLQHCRQAGVHAGEWCERCNWLFVSPDARNKHVQDSIHHWACSRCSYDALSSDGLREHKKIAHLICPDYNGIFIDWQVHREETHFQCHQCTSEFANENERLMVSRDRSLHKVNRKIFFLS